MKISEIIIKLIKEETHIDLYNPSSTQEFVQIRSLYYVLMRKLAPKMSLENIGKPLNKKYTTVIFGLLKFDKYCEKNKRLLKDKERIIIEYNTKYAPNKMNTIDDEIAQLETKLAELKLLKQS